MRKTAMDYIKEAMEREGMLDEINNLRTQLANMQADFAECARGVSPCFFCANDEICNCSEDKDCNFVWNEHN